MENTGYRIADFEQALPEGAVIDEVRYNAKGGQRVSCVIGTVRVDAFTDGKTVGHQREIGVFTDGKTVGHQPAMAGMKTVMVTWDSEGMCRRHPGRERMPQFDLDLGGGSHESGM